MLIDGPANPDQHMETWTTAGCIDQAKVLNVEGSEQCGTQQQLRAAVLRRTEVGKRHVLTSVPKQAPPDPGRRSSDMANVFWGGMGGCERRYALLGSAAETPRHLACSLRMRRGLSQGRFPIDPTG